MKSSHSCYLAQEDSLCDTQCIFWFHPTILNFSELSLSPYRASRFGEVTVFSVNFSQIIYDIMDDKTTANSLLVLHESGLDRVSQNGSKENLITDGRHRGR